MKKEKLIALLNDGLSIEEIPTISNLEEIEVILEKIDFDPKTKKKLKEGLEHLRRETVGHAKAFSDMIKKTA